MTHVSIAWNGQTPYKTALDALSRFKWSVFPLDSGKQPPIIPGKFKDDGEPMRLGWKKYQTQLAHKNALDTWQSQYKPDAWAVITGSLSNIIVLDFDGDTGNHTLEGLGLEPHVRTGSGGHHIYFRHPGWHVPTLNSKTKLEMGRRWPGTDIRGDGGYAAFCGHNAAGQYLWLREPTDLYEITLLPDDLRDFLGLLHAPEPSPQHEYRIPSSPFRRPGRSIAEITLEKYVQEARIRGRDNACFEMACQLRDNNYSESEAKMYAREFARQVPSTNTKGQQEPFTEYDAMAKVESAYGRSARQPWEDLRTNSTSEQSGANNGSNGSAPHTDTAAAGRSRSFNCTDLGNAERFAVRYRHKVCWCETWNTWLIFNGKCWEPDRTGRADQLAKATVRAIYKEAADEEDENQRTKLAKHAAASESNRAIRAMLDRAKSELPATPDQFNKHLHLLNCNNGTIDLRTGELRPHNHLDMLTRCLKVNYNPLAIAPEWLQFVRAIFAGDVSLIDFVQMALGMSLSGDIREQSWFLCHGDGNNGKSTLLETIRAILEDYGLAANIESFLARKEDRNYDKAEFYGKRMITASEIPPKSRLNEAFIKKITGGEDLRAARKFENEFQFTPECTIWLSVNHKPIVKDTSKGMWRRVRYIPFTVTIPDEQVDTSLPKRLLQEAEGILAWLVAGCIAWYRAGRLVIPEVVKVATQKYREEQDTIARFLAEECDMKKGSYTLTSALNARYEQWCEQKQERPDTTALKEALNKLGLHSKRSTGGKWRYEDIELKPIDNPSPDDSDGTTTSSELRSDGSDGSDMKRGKVTQSEFAKKTLSTSMSLPSLPSLSELKSTENSDGTVTQLPDEERKLSTLPTSDRETMKDFYVQVKAYVDDLQKTKKWQGSLYWYGPATGFDSGLVSSEEYATRVFACRDSGDEQRVAAAITAMKRTLGKEEEYTV